jgi:hypothetical protein
VSRALRAFTAPQSYWQSSKAPRYSLLFALPLLVLYEALAAMLSGPTGVRNGADVLLRSAFLAIGGRWGPILLAATLVAVGVWLIGRDLRRNRGGLRPSVFATMLAESVVLALAFGVVVGGLTAQLLGGLSLLAAGGGPLEEMGWLTKIMVSLGAGLYEELVFRVLLVSALVAGARALGWTPRASAVTAVLVSALIFSAFHYVGPMGDTLQLQSFLFRAIAGVAFSALFLLRGFGITAWTHALYDVFLLAV